MSRLSNVERLYVNAICRLVNTMGYSYTESEFDPLHEAQHEQVLVDLFDPIRYVTDEMVYCSVKGRDGKMADAILPLNSKHATKWALVLSVFRAFTSAG
jgi:hypothetical protein